MAAERVPWFHPNLSGLEAEELLKRTVNGSFLFRPSQSSPSDCTLSIKTEAGVTHVRIKKIETGYYLFPDEVFPNLDSFASHYMETPLREKDDTLVHLLSPVLYNEGRLAREGDLNLEKDFEELPSYLYSQDKGSKIQNIHKNRYNASIPFDHNAVTLKEPSVYGSTYINASPIKTGSHQQYIATQGPLGTTISDFWTLVWQEQPSIVIMLTELVEQGEIMCTQYWPTIEEPEVLHGKILISSLEETTLDHYTLRHFLLSHEERDEERHVFHFHFRDWPVGSTPRNTGAFLDYWKEIDAKRKERGLKPMVVHCNDGVGRTGAFIAIDSLLRQRETKRNNVMDELKVLVESLRKQRPGMVQTALQYRYVYQVVEQYEKNDDRNGRPPMKSVESLRKEDSESGKKVSPLLKNIYRRMSTPEKLRK